MYNSSGTATTNSHGEMPPVTMPRRLIVAFQPATSSVKFTGISAATTTAVIAAPTSVTTCIALSASRTPSWPLLR